MSNLTIVVQDTLGGYFWVSSNKHGGDQIRSFRLPFYGTKNPNMLNFVPIDEQDIARQSVWIVHENIPQIENGPSTKQEAISLYTDLLLYAISKSQVLHSIQEHKKENLFLIHAEGTTNDFYKSVQNLFSEESGKELSLISSKKLMLKMATKKLSKQDDCALLITVRDEQVIYSVCLQDKDEPETLSKAHFAYKHELSLKLRREIDGLLDSDRDTSSALYSDAILKQAIQQNQWHHPAEGIISLPNIATCVAKIDEYFASEILENIKQISLKYKNFLKSVSVVVGDDTYLGFANFLIAEIKNSKSYDPSLDLQIMDVSSSQFAEKSVMFLSQLK